MNIKLAEALLRRKELNQKVDQLRQVDQKELFEIKVNRQSVTDNVDNVVAQVPKISINEVTAAYDYYAKQLRLIDAAIQQANWVTEIEIKEDVMKDFPSQIETKK